MKRIPLALIIGIIVFLAACNNTDPKAEEPNQTNEQTTENLANDPPANNENLDNPLIIPSESGNKKETTTEYGTKYKGMGNNIYSTIGSSVIHEGGISSHFESVLKGKGITGVKVFVVDDSVVLARNKKETTSHEYDQMQRNLLSGTEGMAGKGELKGVEGSQNEDEKSYDSLDQAKNEINEMFNGNVKILTVTDSDAVDLINRIQDNIHSSSYQKASEAILKLLKMAQESKLTN